MNGAEMADRKSEKADPRFELEQGNGRHLQVVGRAPDYQPYIWIGSDVCFGTIHTEDLRALRDAINDALGERGSKGHD